MNGAIGLPNHAQLDQVAALADARRFVEEVVLDPIVQVGTLFIIEWTLTDTLTVDESELQV